jgi:hypothetical protein
MKQIACALVFSGLALAMPAHAQSGTYPVRAMDFDLWCTEQQHLPYERCDQRLPGDLQKFEAYRAVVERYEIPYLQEKQQALHFDETILNNDPVDKKPNASTIDQPPPPNAGR